MLVDHRRVFVGPVLAAAVLDDPQAARGDLVLDPVIQADDAVADEFLQAVPGQLVRLGLLAGDDGGDALVLQPAEEPPQLGPQDPLVGQAAENRDSMVSRTTRFAPISSIIEPSRTKRPSRSYSPVSSISLRSTRTKSRASFLRRTRPGHVEPEASDVGGQLRFRLLEGHEDPGLAEVPGSADDELHGHERLAAPGAAADQRRPAEGQARRR